MTKSTKHDDKKPESEHILRETQHREGTKTMAAHQLWDKLHKDNPDVPRSVCIEEAMKLADMTPSSASTLYQGWRSERGMVNHPGDDDQGPQSKK